MSQDHHSRPGIYLIDTRGITVAELLVAMAVSLVFLSGAFAAFVQILRATEKAEAHMEAINNARASLELMAMDIKVATLDTTQTAQDFTGRDNHLTYGDGIDNDDDGSVDEEYFDGEDNDSDWTLSDDNHSVIDGMLERWFHVGAPDLGDYHVDEDCTFDQDALAFRIFPHPLDPLNREVHVTYEIGTYEDESNVLIRRVRYISPDLTVQEEESPLAFNVLSLNFLYWDPNQAPPRWVSFWEGFNAAQFPDPGIELPVAVFISVTVYAGTDPIDLYDPGEPIETVSLSTVANIEQVLNDERYRQSVGNISLKMRTSTK